MTKKETFIVATLLLALIAMSGMTSAMTETDKENMNPQAHLSSGNVQLSNNFLSIVVGTNGTYTMGTAAGKKLLYGFPTPWSSYLTVKIDNLDYRLDKVAPSSTPSIIGNSIVTKWKLSNIEVTESIDITNGTTTGNPDTGLFHVSFKNTGTTAHTVGARYMFDTMLDSNDYAPFKVPGTGDVTTETQYLKSNMPDYWQALNQLTNPTLISEGTLNTPMNTPNVFVLGNWLKAYNSPWNYTVVSGQQNGDSATMVYWNPISLGAGSIISYKTAYGLGGVTPTPGVLYLGITSPLNVVQYGTFTIVGYITNTGQNTANNVTANLILPQGLTLISGNTPVNLGNLSPSQQVQASWQVKANGAPGNYTYTIKASSSNTNSTAGSRNIIVLPPATPLIANFTSNVTQGYAPLSVKFNDTSTGVPTSWKWNFGDGNNSTIQNPTHNYSKAGNYTVSLTVSNAAGNNTTTKTNYITVVAKPVANFASNVTSGKVPFTVAFTDKSLETTTSWKWDFGDGTNSMIQNPTHQYLEEGNYTVKLTVTNTAGSSTATKTDYIQAMTNTRPGIYSKKS